MVEYILTFWAETVVETAHVIAKNAVIIYREIRACRLALSLCVRAGVARRRKAACRFRI